MKLLSRDLRVIVQLESKKRKIEGEQEQIKDLWLQATIARPAFRVLVYRVWTR